MRYMKGMKVEVLNYTKETQSSSWRPCQVISGNGHTYAVRYDHCRPSVGGAAGVLVERVPRNTIRPCPPVAKSPAPHWVPGDFVEVLDNDLSWKSATVCRVLNQEAETYLVKLSNSNMLLSCGSDLRVRQTWENDQWFPLPSKNPNSCNNGVNHDPRRRSRKRPLERSTAEAPRKKSSTVHAAGSISSSVGSCSVDDDESYDPYRSSANFPICSGDAESRPPPRRAVPLTAVPAAETCRPELAEYRRVLKALYAACPVTITWEHIEMLADLCLKLNVSGDEAAHELKRLLYPNVQLPPLP